MTTPSLQSSVIKNLHELIQLKEKHMHQLTTQGKKDSPEYKAIPFKLKFYREWFNKLNTISDWPVSPEPGNQEAFITYLDGLKTTYKFQGSLLDKFREVWTAGELTELAGLRAILNVTAKTTPEVNPATTNPATTNPAKPQEPASSNAIGSNVESVPKKLALEGERPGDDDPTGQKIYDLRLVHGFGEVNAKEFVKTGCTLEILLADWAMFITLPESSGGILDKDLINVPGVDISRLSPTKVFSLKEEVLRSRLSQVSSWLPKLHHDQLVALKYFQDIAQKVPRAEIDKIQRFCQVVAKSLSPEFELMCCGSYRRGRERSGDVDCLLTHQSLKTPADIDAYERENGSIIQAIVALLKKVGFIRDYFAVGETKFMGICRLPDNKNGTYTVFRHIDIRFVPYNSRGTAMLYFTGSFEYNKQMRAKSNEKGYMLSEYGIFKYAKDSKGKKIRGEQVPEPFITEEAVCAWLGMPYLTPDKRDL